MDFLVKFLILFFLAVGIESQIEFTPFISAGTEGKIEELPFLVSIQLGSVHICTGSLISEKFIITSGRCVSNRKIEHLTIEYGSSIINPGSQSRQNTVRVSNIVFHPDFNVTTLENDIAIIEAESEIDVIGFYEAFVHLASSGARFSSGIIATHAGWGHTSFNERNTVLRRANLRIISQSECIAATAGTKLPFFNNICAIEESVLCAGDLGAPLLVNRILVGIASFRDGNECQAVTERYPNVYTAVSFYVSWIESVAGIKYRAGTFLSRS